MLVLFFAFIVVAFAQNYNCPGTTVSDCTVVKKSDKCGTRFQFVIDGLTAYPTVSPVFCMDNPASNRFCMATPLAPSTPTSGFCRPRCVTNQKRHFYQATPCNTITTQADCALSVSNCGSTQTTCDWCAWNAATSTCSAVFICNNAPF